jgi:hypothetical protein
VLAHDWLHLPGDFVEQLLRFLLLRQFQRCDAMKFTL